MLQKILAIFLFFATSANMCSVAAYNRATDSADNLALAHADQQKQNTFSVLACMTWWSHDAVGYHPAMSLFLENTSGHPILGGEIPFQGRFTDLRTSEVTVAREYRRAPIKEHERLAIFLRGPKSYELPIDSSTWPTIECKAMCRFSNNTVEDLHIGHLAQITMSDDEAQAHLVAQAGRSPFLAKQKSGKKNDLQMEEVLTKEQKPMRGKANTIFGSSPANPSSKSAVTGVSNSYPKYLPPVGSDFYAFDKLYGDAIEVQNGSGGDDLTWTHYKDKNHILVKDIFVGSRNANKSDVVIVVFTGALKDKQVMPLAKMLTNSKGETINPFVHSVKYLPAGRFEFMSTAIRDDRILSFHIPDESSKNTVLTVSRLPNDLETLLPIYCKRVSFLKFLGL